MEPPVAQARNWWRAVMSSIDRVFLATRRELECDIFSWKLRLSAAITLPFGNKSINVARHATRKPLISNVRNGLQSRHTQRMVSLQQARELDSFLLILHLYNLWKDCIWNKILNSFHIDAAWVPPMSTSAASIVLSKFSSDFSMESSSLGLPDVRVCI